MNSFEYLKKPIKLLYIITGWLSLNEVFYVLLYKITSINVDSSEIRKKNIVSKFVLMRLFLVIVISLNIHNFNEKVSIIVLFIFVISHIVYLTSWQVAYFFNFSGYIDGITSRTQYNSTEGLFFSLLNFFEIIFCFSILFFMYFEPSHFIIQNKTSFSHIYFSFVNITTLGFGDIYPIKETSQFITISETIIGLLFLVVNLPLLIAGNEK